MSLVLYFQLQPYKFEKDEFEICLQKRWQKEGNKEGQASIKTIYRCLCVYYLRRGDLL